MFFIFDFVSVKNYDLGVILINLSSDKFVFVRQRHNSPIAGAIKSFTPFRITIHFSCNVILPRLCSNEKKKTVSFFFVRLKMYSHFLFAFLLFYHEVIIHYAKVDTHEIFVIGKTFPQSVKLPRCSSFYGNKINR